MEKLKNLKKFGQIKKDQNFCNFSMFQKDNRTILSPLLYLCHQQQTLVMFSFLAFLPKSLEVCL